MHTETRVDTQLYNSLVEKYYCMIYRIAFSYVKNKSDAEDIMQEVFLRFLKKPPQFACAQHEKAWFIKVCINCCKSFMVLGSKRKAEPFEYLENLALDNDICVDDSVLKAVCALKTKQRLCIHLFYYEDMSIKQIADATKMSENTIKSHLLRAKKQLFEALKGEYFNEE